MHIVIATTEFVTEKTVKGGLANYSANLAKMLKQHGHEVSVFTISSVNEELFWEENIKIYRVRYDEFPEKIKKIKLKSIQRYVRAVWNLFGKSYVINKAIHIVNRSKKIDIVHFCNAGSLALFRNNKIPLVVRLSHYTPIWRYGGMPVFEYDKCINDLNYVDKVELMSIKRTKYIFAPSYNVAKLTEAKIKRKIKVIESPFYIDTYKIDDSIYTRHLSNKRYFLFYGTLNYLKGVHVIAGILNKFFANYPGCYFVFIGNNTKMVYQEQEVDASDYIYRNVDSKYHGNILYFPAMNNKEQLYSFIKHAEACVLPSRFDNLPNTCIESMALGQIVIGTNGASFEQLIRDGYNGYLIDREDKEQLYQKIELVLGLSEEEKREMRERAAESISRLEPDKIYKQVIEFYKMAIEERE